MVVIRLRRQSDNYSLISSNVARLQLGPDVSIEAVLNAGFAAFNRGSGQEIELFEGPSASIGDILWCFGSKERGNFMIMPSGFQEVIWAGRWMEQTPQNALVVQQWLKPTPLTELLHVSEMLAYTHQTTACSQKRLARLIVALQATYKVVCEGSDQLRELWLAANAVAWERQGACNEHTLAAYNRRLSMATEKASKEIYALAEPATAAVLVA